VPHYVMSSGQTTLSGDASALGSMAIEQLWIAPHLSNTVAVVLGGSTTQALLLPSGQVVRLAVSNLAQVYAKTSGGNSATVTWLAVTGGPGYP
jgi:hypothetical protein